MSRLTVDARYLSYDNVQWQRMHLFTRRTDIREVVYFKLPHTPRRRQHWTGSAAPGRMLCSATRNLRSFGCRGFVTITYPLTKPAVRCRCRMSRCSRKLLTKIVEDGSLVAYQLGIRGARAADSEQACLANAELGGGHVTYALSHQPWSLPLPSPLESHTTSIRRAYIRIR